MSSLGLRLATSGPSRITRLAASRWTRTRNVHVRRELAYPLEDGLGDFLPPTALKTVVSYQDGLLSRLNDEVKGTLS
jgi:Fe-Mn family superoxide dismutase